MLAVTFMFAGCSASDDNGVKFAYNDQEIAQVAKDACETYQKYASADETYNYVIEAGSDAGISENEIEAVKSFRNIGDECGEFKDFTGEYKITETEGNVIVTLYADCTEKEALIKVTFVDNSATYNLQRYQLMNQYGYSEEQADEALSSQGMYPYKSTDVEIAANMTFEDKMKAAGTNTLIGMATVFVVLIFISFIIYLLRFVPGFFDKEAKAAKKAAKKAAEAAKTEPVAETKAEDAGSAPVGQIVDIVKTETGESVSKTEPIMPGFPTGTGSGRPPDSTGAHWKWQQLPPEALSLPERISWAGLLHSGWRWLPRCRRDCSCRRCSGRCSDTSGSRRRAVPWNMPPPSCCWAGCGGLSPAAACGNAFPRRRLCWQGAACWWEGWLRPSPWAVTPTVCSWQWQCPCWQRAAPGFLPGPL